MTTLLWKPLLSATVPMLDDTEDFDWSVIPFPVWASPKIDGFRSMVQRGVLVSRNGLPVKNKQLQARYGRKEYEGLDGELTDGPPNGVDVFNRTSRVVKKADADASAVRFNIIDYVPSKNAVPFTLSQCISVLAGGAMAHEPGFVVIPQVPIETLAQLKKYEQQCLKQGYEGVMLRRMDQGAYPQKSGKENRSTLREFYLARLKRFEHAEAVIVSVHPLRHNANEERTERGARSSKKAGMVVDATKIGSATLRDLKTGREFDTNIATELLRSMGAKWWAAQLGKTVRYKYQKVGTVLKPRINTCGFDELLGAGNA
jgi:DNA ligase-1